MKNLKIIQDFVKLTNSELKVYVKDSDSDLNKFYYDLTYLLGTTYYRNLKVDFCLGQGWNFSAIYGNFLRLKEGITFQINWIDPSKKFLVEVIP